MLRHTTRTRAKQILSSCTIALRTGFPSLLPKATRKNERIVVTLSSDDYLDAYVWNGSSWKVSNNIGQIDSGAQTDVEQYKDDA
jgi:hypothetical protein